MRKIFLDCGGNKGQSIVAFKQSLEYKPEFEIYSFEPFPRVAAKYKDWPDIHFSNKAVWIDESQKEFYPDVSRRRAEGSSLIIEKRSRHLDKEHPLVVQCLDFSQWVIDNFKKEDYIILKMDVEGAEYEVLDKMIEDRSIEYIDKMFIEFHYHKIGMSKENHILLYNKLMQVKGLQICPEFFKYLAAVKRG